MQTYAEKTYAERERAVGRLLQANPGWQSEYAQGYLMGMMHGLFDEHDYGLFLVDGLRATGYRAAWRYYHVRMESGRTFTIRPNRCGPTFQDEIVCDRCGRTAALAGDPHRSHLCRPKH